MSFQFPIYAYIKKSRGGVPLPPWPKNCPPPLEEIFWKFSMVKMHFSFSDLPEMFGGKCPYPHIYPPPFGILKIRAPPQFQPNLMYECTYFV